MEFWLAFRRFSKGGVSLPVSSADRPQATVFISYAHESEALREQVKALADWLGARGCAVLTDHSHRYRPPAEGWQAWMLRCINEAATVLVICTPKLKLRYEKNEEPETGRGASYEGAIVTQHIYDRAMRNTKFFPILPDEGSYEDIPHTLRSWWNNHFFPSGTEGILAMILAAEDSDEKGQNFRDIDAKVSIAPIHRQPWTFDRAHEEKTTEALIAAPLFMQVLGEEFRKYFQCLPAPATPKLMVEHFVQCDSKKIRGLFHLIRRGLLVIEQQSEVSALKPIEEAAAYLYCLAARRLVNHAVYQQLLDRVGGNHYIILVPDGESVVCGLIAAALDGKALCLTPPKNPPGENELPLPDGKYIFKIGIPTTSDTMEIDIERHAYNAVMNGRRSETQVSIDTGSGKRLSAGEQAELFERIDFINNVEFASTAVAACGALPGNIEEFVSACIPFTRTYNVRVMIKEPEASSKLIGMPIEQLKAGIRGFWCQLKVLPGGTAASFKQTPTPAPEGGQPNSSGQNVQFFGDVGAVTLGSHSAAQAGTGHTANINHRQGADLAELILLLSQLAHEIAALPTRQARDALTAHLNTAEAEAAKKDKADCSMITSALDAIKSGAEVLENGGKIVSLSSKAYNVVAPFWGCH